MGEVIKAYKGFNKDMTCRDFQYEEGKEYEEERAEACNCGFHACEHPLDCLGYYDPAHSVYHEVEQSGEISKRSDDTKVASTKIKIGARVSIDESEGKQTERPGITGRILRKDSYVL